MNAGALLGLQPLSSSIERSATGLSSLTGFYFAFRLFFVLLAVRVFGQDAQVGVAASLALNYLLFAVVVIDSLGQTKRTWPQIAQQPCFRYVVFYFALSGASLAWSVSASQPAAIAFWLAMAADTAIVLWQLRVYDADMVTRSLMGGYVWGASLIAVIAWILPSQSDLRLGDEELLGPNQIGWLCGLAFFFAQYLVRREAQGAWKAHSALLAITLLRCLSKTTIIAFVFAQTFILLRDRTIHRRTKLTVVAVSLTVCAMFAGLLSTYFDVYTSTGNQSESFTGRLGIWAFIFAEALERPWLGHGFHSVWKVIPPFYSAAFEARHAHNELLQQFYAYGAAGVVLVIAIYRSIFRTVRRFASPPMRVFFSGLLLFVLIRGLADTEVFDLSWPMWLIVLFGALAAQQSASVEVQV